LHASQIVWRDTPEGIIVHLREQNLVYQVKVEELDLLDLPFEIAHDLDLEVTGLIWNCIL
jgi:cupin superfamily acireductone dioxygenase involved in methionine salvage